MKTHKPQMLKPRIRVLGSIVEEKLRAAKTDTYRTLRQRQEANGRTLALNGSAWRALRAAVLREQPLCEHCMRDRDMPVMATDVDHIDNDPSNNERSNLASLCHACHSRKTQADMGKRVAHGCDEQGNPRDPGHHWNRPTCALLEKSRATDNREPIPPLDARDGE